MAKIQIETQRISENGWAIGLNRQFSLAIGIRKSNNPGEDGLPVADLICETSYKTRQAGARGLLITMCCAKVSVAARPSVGVEMMLAQTLHRAIMRPIEYGGLAVDWLVSRRQACGKSQA